MGAAQLLRYRGEGDVMLSKNYKEIIDKNYYLRFPIEIGLQIFATHYKVNGGYSELSQTEKMRLDSIHQNLVRAKVFSGKNTSWEDFGSLYRAC